MSVDLIDFDEREEELLGNFNAKYSLEEIV
jgi:hypothetical protein